MGVLEKKEKQLLQHSAAQEITNYKIPKTGKLAFTTGEKQHAPLEMIFWTFFEFPELQAVVLSRTEDAGILWFFHCEKSVHT